MSRTDRRTELRETIFLILFRSDFYETEEMKDQIRDFFEDEDAYNTQEKQFIADRISAITKMIPQIDSELDRLSIGWKTKRMSRVDLTILRLAYYEITQDESIPVAAAINEAVELAKSYGTQNSSSFVNGILAKVAEEQNNG